MVHTHPSLEKFNLNVAGAGRTASGLRRWRSSASTWLCATAPTGRSGAPSAARSGSAPASCGCTCRGTTLPSATDRSSVLTAERRSRTPGSCAHTCARTSTTARTAASSVRRDSSTAATCTNISVAFTATLYKSHEQDFLWPPM